MKRLGRWAFNILAALSLVLCLASLLLAILRPTYVGPDFRSGDWHFYCESTGGSHELQFVKDPDGLLQFATSISSRSSPQSASSPLFTTLRDLKVPHNDHLAFAGIVWLSGDFNSFLRNSRFKYHVLIVNHWTLAVASAVIPLTWVCLKIRARRPPPHLCPKCRYDLRATPDRCPECGTAVIPARR